MARGAEVAHIDIFGEQADGNELRTIGFAQIEVDVLRRRLVAGRFHIEPLERIGLFTGAGLVEIVGGIGKLGGEFGYEVCSDFVTAGADGGADGGHEIGRLAAEFELHAADSFLGDAGEGAAPARVNGGNRAFFRVDEENRHAIGGLDGEEQAGAIGCGGVAFGDASGPLRENADHVRVDLLERNEIEIGSTEGGLKEASIFEDVFASVPLHEAEIEDFFGFEGAYAAGACAEAMDEPRQLAERSEFENLQGTSLANAPRRRNAGSRRFRGCSRLARATRRQ